MIETILSVVEKGIGWFNWMIRKIKQPSIQLRKAPRNIFEHLGPGVSLDRMKELLGAPYRKHGGRYGYKFYDVFVQIESSDMQSISSIGVALPRTGSRLRFPVYPHPYSLILGSATLGDVLEEGMEIKHDYSSKESLLYVGSGYGFPGLYRHFTFGVLQAPFVTAPKYEWDQSNNRLKTDPKKIRINWVAVSLNSEQEELYDYWLFM